MDKKSIEKTLFGTDGIRGKYGEYPLTEINLILLGNSIALWAKEKYGNNPKALIGFDTRVSSIHACLYISLGLKLDGVKTYNSHMMPTPAIAHLVQHDKRFDFGIIITASHNPYQDNGIKIVDKTGKISKADEKKITRFFDNESEILDVSEEAQETYINTITGYFDKDFLKNTKVILDCAHGATYTVAPRIFEQLGAQVITIANKPDGKNINENCGSTHPQTLQKAVLEHKADIGFAFDGDGDRIVAVSKDGQIKDGDDILCLLSEHPLYKSQKNIVGTIMSNYGLEIHLNSKNKILIRTDVGDKHVSKKMREKNLLLGGEQSGHIVLGDYLNLGDGIFTALRILEAIQATGNNNFETFKKCPQTNINIPVERKKDLSVSPFSDIITEHKNMLQEGRVIVRYSGTQNLLRVTVEAEDKTVAKDMCVNISNKLEKELSS